MNVVLVMTYLVAFIIRQPSDKQSQSQIYSEKKGASQILPPFTLLVLDVELIVKANTGSGRN